MPKMKFFAVTGRLNGDDEATAMTFEADDRDHAVEQFKSELCALRNLEPEDAARAMEESPPTHLTVYIDTVFHSASPIEEV